MKICLDPGHYGSNYNPGVAAGYVESNFTWAYYFMLKERLERYGVEVICTRASKDENPGLQARGRTAEGCDLFISIHSNGADNQDANAVFALYSVRSGGAEIAKRIGAALTEFFRGEWGDCQDYVCYAQESSKNPGYDYYGVLKGASSVGVPAVIIEHSFHTNPRYCEWAMKETNLMKMADAEVEAIADYYGLSVVLNDAYFIQLDTDLKKGDKGDAVKKMQMRFRQIDAEFDAEVKAHSFTAEGQPDGSFGGGMVKTVKKFQAYIGLPESGKLDTATRMILNQTVITYANSVTRLLREKQSLTDEYEAKLEETTEELNDANLKIESAVSVLNG